MNKSIDAEQVVAALHKFRKGLLVTQYQSFSKRIAMDEAALDFAAGLLSLTGTERSWLDGETRIQPPDLQEAHDALEAMEKAEAADTRGEV